MTDHTSRRHARSSTPIRRLALASVLLLLLTACGAEDSPDVASETAGPAEPVEPETAGPGDPTDEPAESEADAATEPDSTVDATAEEAETDAGAGAAAPVGDPVSIRAHAGAEVFGFAPFYLAMDEGLFEDEGVTIDLTTGGGGTQAVQALVSGDAQLALQTSLEVIDALRSGVPTPIRVLVPMLTQIGSTFVLQGEVAEELGLSESSTYEERAAALEGLTIAATSPGAATDQLIRYVAQDVGLDPDADIEIAYVGGGPEMLAAFERGVVDGFVISPPLPQIAQSQQGGFILLDTMAGDIPPLDGFQGHSFAVDTDDVEARPEVYEGVVRAMANSLALLQEEPDRARASLASRFTTMEPEVFDATFEAMQASFATSPRVQEEDLETTLQFLASVTGDDSFLDFAFDDIVDTSIADRLDY